MSTRFFDAIFWIAVVACAVAQLFILRAVFRVTPVGSVAKGTVADASGVPTPHRLTEIVWVLLPVALLVLAFVGAWRQMHPVSELPAFLQSGAQVIDQ
jgi:hypothetical protein